MTDEIADGMMELWTIERPVVDGVHIDDFKETFEEARDEIERRGPPWRSVRIVVPYREDFNAVD